VRGQVPICEHDTNKEADSNELTEIRRNFQTLEEAMVQRLEDVRASFLSDIKTEFDSHSASQAEVAVNVEYALKALEQSIQQEIEARIAEGTQLATALVWCQNRLDVVGKEQAKTCVNLSSKLQRLAFDLLAEGKERALADDEYQTLAMMARNLVEREARRRHEGEGENSSLLKLHTNNIDTPEQVATSKPFQAILEVKLEHRSAKGKTDDTAFWQERPSPSGHHIDTVDASNFSGLHQ